ncbi:MAG: hypothetical protein OEZ58_07525 [Gammaproteobacteria bacterium]|nr:hypothetical protein [Gammaproteobacteria bacterium]
MRHLVTQSLAGLFLFFIFQATIQAAAYDPRLQWQTMETEHFYIHFHDGLQPLAQRLAPMAENIHIEVTNYFSWIPKDKTHVTLTDGVDLPNGSATPVFFNQIVLHSVPSTDINSLEDVDDWLRLLMLHEYVHIVHLDIAYGTPQTLRKLFGRYPLVFIIPTFPNLFQPNWLIEGLATYLETDYEKGTGRGQSSYYRALMRMEVQRGIKSYRQLSIPYVDYPGLRGWYLYGVYFHKFLVERYGEEKLKFMINRYSSIALPGLIGINMRRVFGDNMNSIWQEFENYLKKDFANEIATLEKQGLRQGKRLTKDIFDSGFHQIIDNQKLAYLQNDNLHRKQVRLLNPNNNKSERLFNIYGPRFSYHPDKGFLYSNLDIDNNTNAFFDLYLFDNKTGRSKKLTDAGRYQFASFSPNGKKIIAVKAQNGLVELHLLDAQGQLAKTIWQGQHTESITSVDWSPDGKQLVVALFRAGKGWNLELYNFEDETWKLLTHTPYIETHAKFSPDGEHIIYSADYDRVYNVYRLNINEPSAEKLTNVTGAALYPSINPSNNTLYYAGLDTQGLALYELKLEENRQSNEFVMISHQTQQPSITDMMANAPPVETNYPSKSYFALKHLRPRGWHPYFGVTDVLNYGFTTQGNDPLGFLNYDLSMAVNVLDWNFAFSYEQQQIGAQFLSQREHYGDVTVDVFGLFPRYRILQKNWHFSILAGYQYLEIKEQDDFFTPDPLYNGYWATGILNFSNLTRPSRSIMRHSGFDFRLLANKSLEYFAPDEDSTQKIFGKGVSLLGEFNMYSPPIFETIFSARIQMARQNQSMPDFEFVGFQSNYAGSDSINSRRFVLRGYNEPNKIKGNFIDYVNAQWFFPISAPQGTLLIPPIGLNRVNGLLFAEAGRAWYSSEPPKDAVQNWFTGENLPKLKPTFGAELWLESVVLYRVPVDILIGYAKGLGENSRVEKYVRIGASF